MKVALYARVSSDKQDVDLSISAQIRAIREYALKNGYELVREFIDEGLSGRTTARPAFREMIALSKAKQPPFEAILVWKLSRFARSRTDSITYKALLRAKGIEVISINEPFEDTPSGHLFEGIIETLDEFYSANMGQDIKRGMRENASRGYFNGSRPPYGYHKIDVHEGDKAVTLNREGLRTINGERWGRTTVYKILTNEAYSGTLVWGGRSGHPALHSDEAPVRMENAWPAIIDPATFQMVQRKLAAKSPKIVHPRTVPSFYLLSSLLFCSCGRAMIGHSAKSGTHFYYLCSRGFKQGKEACNARAIPKEKLERQVVEQIKSKILTDNNLEELVKLVNDDIRAASNGLKDRMDAIDTELKDIEARLSRL
jgi:site-specific DNA recombinase